MSAGAVLAVCLLAWCAVVSLVCLAPLAAWWLIWGRR